MKSGSITDLILIWANVINDITYMHGKCIVQLGAFNGKIYLAATYCQWCVGTTGSIYSFIWCKKPMHRRWCLERKKKEEGAHSVSAENFETLVKQLIKQLLSAWKNRNST